MQDEKKYCLTDIVEGGEGRLDEHADECDVLRGRTGNLKPSAVLEVSQPASAYVFGKLVGSA